ncbi:hypothetical protein DMN91_011077 [Ooceraea biroi]|uniref:rRNA biogenesis protein RRP5 n=1 Tax=Ooceraea biroi TaxID=2015173 RepID=A0A3L8DAR0_OOCBI|nr:protein RRP5 homolog [Ooceraea biroi]XP_011330403.2 protein RRP5 homolog [Ooceraea biroi]RLU17008.1 hypothetical protein DMN91_011077 [Ooceraea biroi]
MTLKSFPRGGEKFEIKKRSFEVPIEEERKSKKKRKTQAKKVDNDITEDTNLIATTADRLSRVTLCEGMVILGRISEISEYDLIVSIPGGLLGRVEVTNISESYTNLLQSIISSNDTHLDEFKPLSDLYSAGDYVVCYVKSANAEGKWLYNLSLEPQLVNRNIYNSHLVTDTKIACGIKSVEDHGYVVDTGVANVRAFLATEDVDKGKQYFPGNQLFCVVKEIETVDRTSVIKLSAKKRKINNVSTHDTPSLDALTPGTKLQLRVTKVLSNGLQITFGNRNVGYVNQVYLDNPAYTENTKLTGTLLYVLPTVKLAYFSLLTDTSERERLKVGDVIQKARVLFREAKGIVFRLSMSGLRGFVSLRRTDVPPAKIPAEFKEGSAHRCRVLSYNWTEHLYVCTMEHDLLKRKYFSASDLKLGDTLNVTVVNVDTKSGFVQVQVGKIWGAVPPEHVSDVGSSASSKLKVGDGVEARVLDNDKVKFTLKQSLIKSKLPVLHDIHEARCGSKYHGTVTKISKTGMLVRFYGDVKGWVPRANYGMSWNYSLGQTVTVCVEHVEKEEGKMKLKIVSERQEERPADLSIGEMVEGTITESSVNGVQLRINKEGKVVTGFLPASHMAPCIEVGSLLSARYAAGDEISALVFSREPSLTFSRTFVTQEQYRSFDALKVGDCIPCTIRDISADGVRVILPVENYSKFGFVPYKNISNFELLQVNQIQFVKIIAINKREKHLALTMSLKDVWDNLPDHEVKMMTAVDVLSLYLSKLSELANQAVYKGKPISSAILGQKVSGTVDKITKHGLILRLDNHLTGTVRMEHYSGIKLKVGDKVYGTILWKNYIHDLVDVSILPRIVNGISSKQKTLPQLPTGVVLRAEILMISKWFILVLIKRNGVGYLAVLPVRRHINDVSPDLSSYKIHAKIRVYVVVNGDKTDVVPICMLKSAFEVSKNAVIMQSTTKTETLKRKDLSEDINLVAKKSKLERRDDVIASKSKQTNENEKKLSKTKEAKCDSGTKRQKSKIETKTSKDQDTDMKKENRIKDINELDFSDASEVEEGKLFMEKFQIPECGFSWDSKPNQAARENVETSSDEEEEPEEALKKKKKKKLSAAERREQERQREREIRQREEALASNRMPNSIDQFDRLVLSSPDSSLVWLQYMTYHLQATEIDKARAIARRAIKTINFREENERVNVWNAWLNLESRYGNTESLNDVLQEALRTNDAFKVYTHMLTVHADAGRQAELEKLIGTMIGKFKQDLQTWVECGTALLKTGLKEKSRHIMQRALQSLPESHHVNLLVRFANLENKFGDKERAQTLFEKILTSYPKRVDVWSCYVDCLTRSEDIDIARRVLERACVQTLPARKMKTLFKKFMSFEEKYGTPETVSHVQQMAADYVEKQCNAN